VLRRGATELFDRLREANVLLQEVLSGATENLGKIEGTLSTRVREFVTTMGEIGDRSASTSTRMEEQIKAFQGVTTGVLRDISQTAAQLEERSRALAAAAEAIDSSNKRTSELVDDRRNTLETLSSYLEGKTSELDQRLVRFAGLLKDTFEAAEGRAREVARLIADTGNEGARTIASQHDLMRTTAEEERKRTIEALNGVYEQATGDVHALFSQAAERFAGVVRDMKDMAAEMQRELDTTRSEMRRGILELPQEAAESTAQMRRVIVEQIDALAELNRIVARHGRGMDAVEPV